MTNFCAQPWIGLDIDPQGNLRPCCKYQSDFGTDIEGYFNSSELANLKDLFLKDQRPPGCIRCWNDEDAGLPSKRILDKVYRYDKSNLSDLQILSVPFGNTCNLSCRTCYSGASSKWAEEEKKLKTKFNIQIYPHKKFYKDSAFINFIKNKASTLIDISFPGGESFLTGVQQHHDYLDFLLEQKPQDVTLTYMTNATTFPDNRYWEKWKYFKKVNISLSIDGINDKFEYLRWPAQWNVCYENIKKYQNQIDNCTNMQLSISHTVSIFNVLYLNEFFIWCFKEKLPEPYLGMVETPEYYNVKNLPKATKELVQKKLVSKKFSPVISFINQEATIQIDDFLSWTAELDSLRNQDFTAIFPELANIIKQ